MNGKIDLIDFSDKKTTRRILKSYTELEILSENGISWATALLIDIKDVLYDENILKDIERECVINILIKGYVIEEYAKSINRSFFYVQNNTQKAVQKISAVLGGK